MLITDNGIVTSWSIRVNELFVGCFQTGTRLNFLVDTLPPSSIQAIYNRKRVICQMYSIDVLIKR